MPHTPEIEEKAIELGIAIDKLCAEAKLDRRASLSAIISVIAAQFYDYPGGQERVVEVVTETLREALRTLGEHGHAGH